METEPWESMDSPPKMQHWQGAAEDSGFSIQQREFFRKILPTNAWNLFLRKNTARFDQRAVLALLMKMPPDLELIHSYRLIKL